MQKRFVYNVFGHDIDVIMDNNKFFFKNGQLKELFGYDPKDVLDDSNLTNNGFENRNKNVLVDELGFYELCVNNKNKKDGKELGEFFNSVIKELVIKQFTTQDITINDEVLEEV